jgi:hypothetical protein
VRTHPSGNRIVLASSARQATGISITAKRKGCRPITCAGAPEGILGASASGYVVRILKLQSPIVVGSLAMTVSNIAAAPLLADSAAPTIDT